MTADTTPRGPELEPVTPDDVETVEPKLTKAQQAEADKRAKANVPEDFHEQAVAEQWAEGQQGPFGR